MDLTARTSESTQGMPLKDFGSFVHTSTISDAEIKDHRSADTVYVGLHLPRQRERGHRRGRHRHGHSHSRKNSHTPISPEVSMTEGRSSRSNSRSGILTRADTYHAQGHAHSDHILESGIGHQATPPAQHVQFLLGEDEVDEEHKTHDLFCELGELFTHDGEMEWKETARWIKFEEDVEEGGERWSKPHVATLSLHSLFELRSCLHSGAVLLDMDAQFFFQVIDIMLDNLVATNQLEEMLKDQVREVLLQRHRHLNEKVEKKHHDHGSSKIHLPIIRSLADIGRKYSLPKEMHNHHAELDDGALEAGSDQQAQISLKSCTLARSEFIPFSEATRVMKRLSFVNSDAAPLDDFSDHGNFNVDIDDFSDHGNFNANIDDFSDHGHGHDENSKKLTSVKTMPNMMNSPIPKNDSSPAMDSLGIKRNQSSGNDLPEVASSVKLNMHFMKKIPPGAEAANVLVGEVDFLNHQIVAFIRLKNSMVMGDLTEVPVPTKFLFLLLGPLGNQSHFHEIGRAIATLMTDEVFHDVAYHAHNRDDLLAGIDEFLDQVTVLPPGEWDPSIRIEPPKSVPSQEGRKTGEASMPLPNGKVVNDEEEESHGDDPALQRTGRLFGGLIQDIRRKAPFYVSDFKDALHVQSLASFMFLYFACLTPIITFGGLLADATGKDLGAFESLLAGAIVGIIYALFSGQPLTILGSTGPVLVFETILYNFSSDNDWNYLSFRWWVGMWTGLILIIMVAFDLSALVRYITRFTEESFAALISLIFIKEAVAKLVDITEDYPVNMNPHVSPFHDCICVAPGPVDSTTKTPTNDTGITYAVPNLNFNVTTTLASVLANETSLNVSDKEWHKIPRAHCEANGGALLGDGCDHVADVFFLSVLLFIGTFTVAYALKALRNAPFFPTRIRTVISDFAVVISIGTMVGLDAIIGLRTPKLEVPDKFHPTNHENRGWVIPPFHEKNPPWLCIAALIPALLATILLFMDQQITAVIVNRKENKLKKGCGYHLDLLIVAVLIMINSGLGLPYFVAATVLSINHVMSLKKESTCTAPGERPAFLGVREQRVTGVAIFLMIGLSVFLTSLLKFIPMAVLYGVFLYMGISSLKGMQLVNRVMIWFIPMKYQPDYTYLRHVRTRRVHLFTVIQIFCLVMLWVIKTIKSISIAFPIMVLAMCFIRKALDWLFSQTELKWLDDIMPEVSKREKDDKDKLELVHQEEECETLLDPKCSSNQPNFQPKASIVNLAINGGNESFVNHVNITEEVTKCSIWKNLQSSQDPGYSNTENGRGSERESSKRKHKKHHKKENNGNHHGYHNHSLPTIPSSPTRKEHRSGSKKNSVAFYIDEEESDKEDSVRGTGFAVDHVPTIVVDPPAYSSLKNE